MRVGGVSQGPSRHWLRRGLEGGGGSVRGRCEPGAEQALVAQGSRKGSSNLHGASSVDAEAAPRSDGACVLLMRCGWVSKQVRTAGWHRRCAWRLPVCRLYTCGRAVTPRNGCELSKCAMCLSRYHSERDKGRKKDGKKDEGDRCTPYYALDEYKLGNPCQGVPPTLRVYCWSRLRSQPTAVR